MTTLFNRDIYFDAVRASLFSGKLTQQQVEGQEAILGEWELPQAGPAMTDIRWLAYALATAYHETAKAMWPVEEYGKGKGMKYGTKDSETGQTYYGRGYVQLTWRENYRRATQELGLKGEADLEWHAQMALDPQIAADTMFQGMREGWFRGDDKGRQTLARYFDADTNDAYGAREIINGDKHVVPSWSSGVSIGNLIKGYHGRFLDALKAASAAGEDVPQPPEPAPAPELVTVGVNVAPGTLVAFYVNGRQLLQATAANGEEAA